MRLSNCTTMVFYFYYEHVLTTIELSYDTGYHNVFVSIKTCKITVEKENCA